MSYGQMAVVFLQSGADPSERLELVRLQQFGYFGEDPVQGGQMGIRNTGVLEFVGRVDEPFPSSRGTVVVVAGRDGAHVQDT